MAKALATCRLRFCNYRNTCARAHRHTYIKASTSFLERKWTHTHTHIYIYKSFHFISHFLKENGLHTNGQGKKTQAVVDGRQMVVENVESKVNSDLNRKKHGRGRGSVSGRGRGSRVNDQTRSQISSSTVSPSNGQLENSHHKVCLLV